MALNTQTITSSAKVINRAQPPEEEEYLGKEVVHLVSDVNKRAIRRYRGVEIVIGNTIDYEQFRTKHLSIFKSKVEALIGEKYDLELTVGSIALWLNSSAYNAKVNANVWIGLKSFNLKTFCAHFNIKKASLQTDRDELTIKKLSKILLPEAISELSTMTLDVLSITVKFLYTPCRVLGFPNAFMIVPASMRVTWTAALKHWEATWTTKSENRFSKEADSWFSANPKPVWDLDHDLRPWILSGGEEVKEGKEVRESMNFNDPWN